MSEDADHGWIPAFAGMTTLTILAKPLETLKFRFRGNDMAWWVVPERHTRGGGYPDAISNKAFISHR